MILDVIFSIIVWIDINTLKFVYSYDKWHEKPDICFMFFVCLTM